MATRCFDSSAGKGCGLEWTALNECHCLGKTADGKRCHQHFANIKAFDAHQITKETKKGEYLGVTCLSLAEIGQAVTEHQSKASHPTFKVRENGTITLFDPYRDERLKEMTAKASTTSKTTKAAAKPKAEKRVCAEDGCKRVLKKKPGRGRWPVRCIKHGGTGLV